MNDRLRKKDCDKLYRQEAAFLKKNYPEPSIKMQERIAKYVPEKLNETLCKAFCKSFQLILEKGNGVIEVTYHKEKMQEDFKVDQYAMEVRKGSSVSNTLHRKAVKGNLVNQLLTTVEGVGMGVIGMGIPDITCQKKITEFALIKYKRRYLSDKKSLL